MDNLKLAEQTVTVNEETQKCSRCQKEKPLQDFKGGRPGSKTCLVCRNRRRHNNRTYNQSQKGRAKKKAYEQSPERRAAKKAYRQSERGKALREAAAKNYTAKLLGKGLCPRHPKRKILHGHDRCEQCKLRNIVKNIEKNLHIRENIKRQFGNGGVEAVIKDLVTFFDSQDPYTGQPLKLGENLSIDHAVAKSRGGNDDFSNLVPMEKDFNTIKYRYNDDEILCLAEYHWTKKQQGQAREDAQTSLFVQIWQYQLDHNFPARRRYELRPEHVRAIQAEWKALDNAPDENQKL